MQIATMLSSWLYKIEIKSLRYFFICFLPAVYFRSIVIQPMMLMARSSRGYEFFKGKRNLKVINNYNYKTGFKSCQALVFK